MSFTQIARKCCRTAYKSNILQNVAVVGTAHPQFRILQTSVLPGMRTTMRKKCGNQDWRRYSTTAKLSMDDIRCRVLKVVSSYDKIADSDIGFDSHFIKDLGLDSLDHVEVIMAIEDEFGFEIPDPDAEKLVKPTDIVTYVAQKKGISE